MILKIFSIRDAAAEAFFPPFFMATRGMAMREFETACKNTESNIGRYPSQFNLYELGEFDDAVGTIDVHPEPHLVIQGLSMAPKLEKVA